MAAKSKEKFELLYEMLKRYYGSLLEGTVAAAGVLIVVAGWVGSSTTLRYQLCLHPWMFRVAFGLPIIGFVLYVYIAWRVFHLSNKTADFLDNLAYMENKYYENYRIKWFTLIIYIIAGAALTTAICVVIYTAAYPPCTTPAT